MANQPPQSSDDLPEENKFFFLSDLTPREFLSSLLKPNSSKSSLPQSMFSKSTDSFSDSSSYGSMASTLSPPVEGNQPSAPPSIRSFNMKPDQVEQGATPPAEQWKPGKKEWLVMIALTISSLTVALDATILVNVLPTLAIELDGTTAEAFWAGTSYLLSSAVVQPFIAALSDIFGRRELLVPSLILFTVSSIICGVAKDFTTLLIGRVIQGIGGGGIITLAQVIYGDIVPLRQRPRYFALVLGAWALGSTIGPIIGGVFVQKATWRWCFWINLPICGIALPMSFFFVKLTTERKSLLEKLRLVDWIGGFIFIASLTSALVAISFGGIDHPWDSWRTIVPLVIGIVGTLLSLVWERYFAKNPFLRHSLFPNISSIATYVSAFFQGLMLFIALYYLSFYFTAAKLATPISSGVKLLPAVVFVLPGSVVVSALITRFGTYRWAIWIGWALTTLGCGLLILLNEHTGIAISTVALAVLGLGLGMILSSVNFATQASVTNDSDSGRAAAMYAFMRTLGMTVGVALGGTIFQNLMKQRLRAIGLDDAIATHAEGFVEEVLKHLDPEDPLRARALSAYAYGFRGIFIAMTAISAVALVGTACIRHFCMDRILESKYSLEKSEEQQHYQQQTRRITRRTPSIQVEGRAIV